ncbi:Voltage-dependent chloride channel 1, chloroplastic-like protein [Drosera capensis]
MKPSIVTPLSSPSTKTLISPNAKSPKPTIESPLLPQIHSNSTHQTPPFPYFSQTHLQFLHPMLQFPNLNSKPPKTLTLISILRAVPDWTGEIKERGMRKKRALYDHEKWVHHRSSVHHVRHLLSALSSRVILSLIPPVTFFTLVAVAFAGYNTAVMEHWLPEFLPVLRASSLPYQLTAPALALLLVFRTEASYSRFEEGRKAWTMVISGTNDFFRQCHLIYGSDAKQDQQDFLEADDIDVVLGSTNRSRCIIDFISQSLKLLNLEEQKRYTLVGVLIEEPFPMLALDERCKEVASSIWEAIVMEKAVQSQVMAKWKIHDPHHSSNGWPNP